MRLPQDCKPRNELGNVARFDGLIVNQDWQKIKECQVLALLFSSDLSYSTASAWHFTCVLAVEELLFVFVSTFVPLTVAVFLTTIFGVHECPSCTTIWIVAPFRDDNDNGMIVPTGQLTTEVPVQVIGVVGHESFLLTIEQTMFFPDALTRVVSRGNVSTTTTFAPFDGPRSPTPIV